MGVYDISGADLQNTAYDVDGSLLSQAYDIDGNEVYSEPPVEPVVELVSDYATGQYYGYSFHVANLGNEYKTYDILNVLQYDYNLQSFGYDPDTERFYEFDESNKIRVYDKNFNHLELLYNYDLNGHCNDTVYYNGKFYFPDIEPTKYVYWWNVADNTAGALPVYGIEQPLNGSTRCMAAICETENRTPGKFYLVCADYAESGGAYWHRPDDKLSIYLYDLNTHTATLQKEFLWTEDRFLQGAYVYDGILYAACNKMPPQGGRSVGIVFRAYNLSKNEVLNALSMDCELEPEGLGFYPFSASNEPQFMFGVGEYATDSEIIRCAIPYRIVYPNN